MLSYNFSNASEPFALVGADRCYGGADRIPLTGAFLITALAETTEAKVANRYRRLAVHNQLANQPSDNRRQSEAVSAKPGGKDKPGNLLSIAQHRDGVGYLRNKTRPGSNDVYIF